MRHPALKNACTIIDYRLVNWVCALRERVRLWLGVEAFRERFESLAGGSRAIRLVCAEVVGDCSKTLVAELSWSVTASVTDGNNKA
jgi:hypothetical protein